MIAKKDGLKKYIKFSIRVESSLISECDTRIAKANCRSRTEYIEKALNFYNMYLDKDENLDLLSPYLEGIITSTVEASENRMNRNLFKLAVEQAKILNILAAFHKIHTIWRIFQNTQAETSSGIKRCE